MDRQLRERLSELLPLFDHQGPAASDLTIADTQRLGNRRLGEAVDAERRRKRIQERRGGRRADRITNPQTGEPVDLRESAKHEQARKGFDKLESGVFGLDVLELDVRLVEQDVHMVRHTREESADGLRV